MIKLLNRKKINYLKVFRGIIGVSTFVVVFSSLDYVSASPKAFISESPKEVIDQVWQIVYRDFLDSSGKYNVDSWKLLRKQLLANHYIDKSESYEAIRGMLSTLDDPYTRFLDPKEFKEMRIDTSGELTGVGIQLSLDKETNNLIVVSPIDGTPAANAGIQPNDVIISIDGQPTKGMSIENAVKLIRGKQGTSVNLGISRDKQIISFPLVRDRIEILAVNSKLNITNLGAKVGYIRLKQFNANAAKEMRRAIKTLEDKNVDGYVLDLRSNPGGLLEASIDISRQWLDKGTIVSTQTRNGIKDRRRANGTALTSLPVVVLVNEGSASASEILSGAIQDNNRGILVGKKTFGKGLVQSVRTLADGSGITVTIAKYLTPNGTDIHKNGILPDVIVEMPEADLKILTAKDLGTYKDKQYQVAETSLMRSIKKISVEGAYNPSKYHNLLFNSINKKRLSFKYN